MEYKTTLKAALILFMALGFLACNESDMVQITPEDSQERYLEGTERLIHSFVEEVSTRSEEHEPLSIELARLTQFNEDLLDGETYPNLGGLPDRLAETYFSMKETREEMVAAERMVINRRFQLRNLLDEYGRVLSECSDCDGSVSTSSLQEQVLGTDSQVAKVLVDLEMLDSEENASLAEDGELMAAMEDLKAIQERVSEIEETVEEAKAEVQNPEISTLDVIAAESHIVTLSSELEELTPERSEAIMDVISIMMTQE